MGDGFVLYYNYLREHITLGMTPAEKAMFDLKLDGSRWLALIKKAKQNETDVTR